MKATRQFGAWQQAKYRKRLTWKSQATLAVPRKVDRFMNLGDPDRHPGGTGGLSQSCLSSSILGNFRRSGSWAHRTGCKLSTRCSVGALGPFLPRGDGADGVRWPESDCKAEGDRV